MKYFISPIFFILLLQLPDTALAGGPWAEGRGKGYVEAGALFGVATQNLDHTYQLYSEIGVMEKLTLKVVLPMKYVGSPDNLDATMFRKGKVFGMGNAILGLKYEFFKKKVVLSAGLETELRTVSALDEFGLRTGFEKFTFRPVFSTGWGTDKVYAYGELKPGFSTNHFGHDINFVSEIGGRVDEKVWLAAYFEIKGVFKNGSFNDSDAPAYAATGYYRDQQNYLSFGAKFAAYLHKGFGLNTGIFYGRGVNQPDGGGSASVKVGLFYDW